MRRARALPNEQTAPDDTNGEFSPTGDRVATAVGVGSESKGVWIKQLGTGAFSPLTSGRTDRRPIWSPDGKTIAFPTAGDPTPMTAAASPAEDGAVAPQRYLVRIENWLAVGRDRLAQ